MNKIQRHTLSLALALVLLAIPTIVLAKELGMLTISGPGIKGEATLNDPKAMVNLEQSGFFDQASVAKPPANLGQGYTITAHLNLDGKLVPFIQLVYYPAEEGQPGFMHTIGRLDGESLRTVDEWSKVRPGAETAFRNLMTANGITLQPAIVAVAPEVAAPAAQPAKSEQQTVSEPASAPSVVPAPIQTYYVAAALAASILILLGAGFVMRHRATSQRSA